MSRRGRGKPQTGISLFPFLAVLICTMGALIVLLLCVVLQAKANASAIAAEPSPAQAPEVDEKKLRERIEDADWRHEILAQQRQEKAEELSNQRLELAHLEDHIRRLQDKWKDLEEQARRLQSADASQSEAQQQVASQMSQIAAEIAQAKQELAAAREQSKRKPRSFSIIPYDGPNGTSRRPIYIECTEEHVILQPEGFVLDARDFEGPLGPGNPLDACLRAIREYLARNPDFKQQGEPYPLLIVRPNGVLSYSAARAAMKSWDDEFGYELVEDDTQLAYPAPDPTLRMILERAVADARRRQELLAAAAPSRYRGAGGDGRGGAPAGGFRSVVPVPDFEEGSGQGGGNAAGSQGIGRGGGGTYNEGYTGSRIERGGGSKTGEQQSSATQGRHSQGSHTRTGRPGGQQGVASSGNTGGGSSGGPNAGAGSVDGTAMQGETVKPLANKKGENWGLPNYTPKATGITRPIRVRVEADRLLILPERGERRAARVVPIESTMTHATETLVSNIWDEVDGWGIAVSNGYWKPVLNVEVAPGQDMRFEQLQTLLDGSGLDIRRRDP